MASAAACHDAIQIVILLVDFDLYLLRPGRDDIVLNQARVIADYHISKNVRKKLVRS